MMRYYDHSISKNISLAFLIAFICSNFMDSSKWSCSFHSWIDKEKSSFFLPIFGGGLREFYPEKPSCFKKYYSIKALKSGLTNEFSKQKDQIIMENELTKRISGSHIFNGDSLFEIIKPHSVYLIWIFNSILFIILDWKKRERMTGFVIIISLFAFFQSAYCGPIKSVVNTSYSYTGHMWTGISAEKNKYYCLHGLWGLGGNGYNYITNAYDSSGNFLEQKIDGYISQSDYYQNAYHAIVNISGGCKIAEINGNTNGKLSFCSGSINNCPEFTFTTSSNINVIQKLMPVSTGGFVVIGWSTYGAYIKKIAGTSQWDWEQFVVAPIKFYGVVELSDLSYLALAVAYQTTTQCCGIYQYTTSGALGNPYTFTQGNSLICYDMKLLTDGNIVIVGLASSGASGITYATKRSTLGAEVWTQMFSGSISDGLHAVMQHSDGNIIAVGATNQISQGGTSYGVVINATLSTGSVNWGKVYGGANSVYFYDVAQTTDYSFVAVGAIAISTGSYALYTVTMYSSCPSGLLANSDATDCVSLCPLGYQLVVNCQPCPAGTYSNVSGTPCAPCPAGTYQDLLGQTACKQCPIKTISKSTGLTVCTACPAGYFQCQTGKTSCNVCNGFCGPCKFYDRNLCYQLNSICWADYQDTCVFSPIISMDCIKAVAKVCYKIWLANGIGDPQCSDFVNYLNFALMQTKPTLQSAAFAPDGQSFSLTFDQAIYQTGLTDATAVFSQETLSWLPSSKSIKWTDLNVLKVSYQPQNNILTSLTLKNQAIFINYQFAQEGAVAKDFPITQPSVSISIKIDSPSSISECDNIDLNAVLLSQSFYPVVFKWSIVFSTYGPDMTTKMKQAADQYFQTFKDYSNKTSITIPNAFFTKGCLLDITLMAQASIGLGYTFTKTSITVKGSLHTFKFTNKANPFAIFPSDKISLVPYLLNNQKCRKPTRRLLQNSDFIDIILSFEIYSGDTMYPSVRGDDEIKLEADVRSSFEKCQSISLDFSKGYKFNTYYKLKTSITDQTSKDVISDELLFIFQKPPVVCVIDSVGGIVSLEKDVVLNGKNSVIPAAEGDIVQHVWSCNKAYSFVESMACACPTQAASALTGNQLTIPKSKLQDLCKYSYSLTISASSSYGTRTASNQIEFLAFRQSITPVYGRILPGFLTTVRDCYFTFELIHDCPGCLLTYEWQLVEVVSMDPMAPASFSQKNTFIYNYLKLLGAKPSSSIKNDDTHIPAGYIPRYITSIKERNLGVDRDTLKNNTKYTFGVIVTYPDIHPSFEFVYYNVPPAPRERIFTIIPLTGFGMSTKYTLMFNLPLTTDIDLAKYQIFRRDCPSSNEGAVQITQVLDTTNSFSTVLAPGLKSCKYQVEIILRAMEYDSYKEMKCVITVENSQKSSTTLVTDALNMLTANNDNTSPNSKINLLSQAVNCPVTEESYDGKKNVDSIMGFIDQLDSASGVRKLIDSSGQIGFLNTTSSIMGTMLTTQTKNVDPSVAITISSKMGSYLSDVSTIPGGTSIIPNAVNTLSGVVHVGKETESDNTFYESVHAVVDQIPAMKLKEIVAGAPSYSLSSSKIEIVMNNTYSTSFNTPQAVTSQKGSKMRLPGGFNDTLINPTLEKKIGGIATIVTTMNAVAYNPVSNMKAQSYINTSDMGNLSCTMADSDTIGQIYADLAAGKLNEVVDTKEQSTDILETTFTLSEINKDGSSSTVSDSVSVGNLPSGKKVNWTLPVSRNPDNSLAMPMYYLPDTDSWTNKGCLIIESDNPSVTVAQCDNLGASDTTNNRILAKDKPIDIRRLRRKGLKITIDIIKDLFNVMKSGNYKMLVNFGAFANAGWENYLVVVCVVVYLIFVFYMIRYLNLNDNWPLFEEMITTLYERYDTHKEEDAEGFLKNVYIFNSIIRKKGMVGLAKSQQQERVDTSAANRTLAEPPKRPNGYNVLKPHEEEKLKDLYILYDEHCKMFPNGYFFKRYNAQVFGNVILKRLTQSRLADELTTKPPTFWRILKVST